MAKMAVTEDVKGSGSFKPVPAGVRDLEVRMVKDEVASQSSENFYANVGFVIAGGPNPGRWVWDRFMTSGNGISRAAGLYEAIFGKNPLNDAKIGVSIDPYEWLQACEGHFVRSEVVLGLDQQNNERNFIGGQGKSGGGFKFEPSPLEEGSGAKHTPAPPKKKVAGASKPTAAAPAGKKKPGGKK